MDSSKQKDTNGDEQLIETRIDSQIVYHGGFFNVSKDNVKLPNGAKSTREYIRHPGAVAILPMFDDNTVLLERQFRYPVNKVFIEFPAGKLDPNESKLTCAKRELQEETGYQADNWYYVTTIHNAIGYSDESLAIYLATGLHAGQRHLDEEEFINTCRMPISELLEMVQNGNVSDVKTIIGAFWLEKIVQNQWKLQKILTQP